MTATHTDDPWTAEILDHAAQAVGAPDLIRLRPGLFALRFEVMKVRSARGAVQHLLAQGKIRPGDTVVDSSSGIYALALALACHEAGLRCMIVGSTTVDETLRLQLGMLGARLEQMPPSDCLRADQDRRVARIRELLAEHPDWHWMRQYHDAVHYRGYRDLALGLGERLRREGFSGVDMVAPVGSGASSGALALGLAESGLAVRLTGVQPFGSVTFGSEAVEDPDMLIAGIGSSMEFRNVRHKLYREIHWVSAEVSRAGAVSLCRDHALFAELRRAASQVGEPERVVALAAGGRARVEAHAVVHDVQGHGVLPPRERDDGARGVRVGRDIGQGGLRGTDEERALGPGEVRDLALHGELAAQPGVRGTCALLGAAADLRERGGQGLVEGGGGEVAHEAPRLGEVRGGGALDRGQARGGDVLLLAGQRLLGRTGDEHDGGEPLCEGVVDLPGEPLPLGHGPGRALLPGELLARGL